MFGRRGVFGKKSRPSQADQGAVLAPTVDVDGVVRCIPKAVWDEGSIGDMLRECGMSPDDPSNLAMTPERADAMFDARKAEQDKFVSAINAKLPDGCSVIPWAMLPWSLWGGSNAEFLFKMGFTPVESWNTMLLAEDEPSASVLGLPVHPRAMFEGLEEAADRLIGELRSELHEFHVETGAAVQRGDGWSALIRYNEASTEAKSKIVVLSHYLGQHAFGEAAWERHKELFGLPGSS